MIERVDGGSRVLRALLLASVALAPGCNQVAKIGRSGSSGGSSIGRPEPSADANVGGSGGATDDDTRPTAPQPQLGAGVPAPGYLLGLSREEAAAVKSAPAGGRLAKLRELVLQEAQRETALLRSEPGRHLIDRRMNKDVPAAQALDLGFLIEWNERVDALGLAYAITGDAKYAQRVDAQLLPWANYSPPSGEGLTKGGEPGIYHRNFFGVFRAAEQCWPALSPAGRAAAVKLAIAVQERMEDWWKRTPWERGNHAAATAQTGIYAGILLVRAAADDAKRIAPADAAARLDKYLNAGANLPQQALVGGEKRQPGLLGFGPQALIGVLTEQNAPCYRSRDYATDGMLGASIDFFYKPPDRRFGYHALLTHHLLTSYWAVVRSGLDRKVLAQASEVRRAIGQLLEFTRPYLERGEVLATAKGKATDPRSDARTREIVAMAARLFPEKAWLEQCRLRGEPVHFTELYAEAARFE